MRPGRLLPLPLAVLLALAAAPPAMAVDWTVDVTANFTFAPSERQIAVGDKVTWRFQDGGHTTTSRPGQAERWDSNLRSGGGIYEHTFTKPGRYQYVCTPHASFMSGVIQVGGDAVARTTDGFRTKRRGRSVTVSVTLNEAASLTYKLKGPSRRTVKRGRLAAGSHSFKVKRLAKGRYRGTLTLKDDFDKRTTRKSSFRIR
jgi:plastocyanin